MSSTKHAGGPWELGLAETQQTLLRNGLRDRVVLQVDGSMKTGRDVVVAALLGAEEYGFSTAPLVVEGCIMMRVCHLDTCPVGVATQTRPAQAFQRHAGHRGQFLRVHRRRGEELLAEMGVRALEEAIGHAELLAAVTPLDHPKAAGLDLSRILCPRRRVCRSPACASRTTTSSARSTPS